MGAGAGASAARALPARITAAKKIVRVMAPKAAITTKARSRSRVCDDRAEKASRRRRDGGEEEKVILIGRMDNLAGRTMMYDPNSWLPVYACQLVHRVEVAGWFLIYLSVGSLLIVE